MAIIKTFFTQPQFPVKDIFIIGAGAFGRRALERLSKKYPGSSITIVDNAKESLDSLPDDVKAVQGDGVEFLIQNNIQPNTWIIPAIPIHVAREWLAGKLQQKNISLEPVPIPEEMRQNLPNPFVLNGRSDILFVSIADFVCPDNCPEPPQKCTHTGKPRPGNLYEMIAGSVPALWSAIVFRSFQLAPGVGGYPASYLMGGLETLEKELIPGEEHSDLIIATACRCHGVISAVRPHWL